MTIYMITLPFFHSYPNFSDQYFPIKTLPIFAASKKHVYCYKFSNCGHCHCSMEPMRLGEGGGGDGGNVVPRENRTSGVILVTVSHLIKN